MIVIDASVLAEALTGAGRVAEDARTALSEDPRWAAPSHLMVEAMSVIRGRLFSGKITRDAADGAVTDMHEIVVDRVDENCLLNRMWELRGNLTSYDAAYVAAAEALDCPLITADGKLARATGPRCEIHLVAAAE